MRLRRFFVRGFPSDSAPAVMEFLLLHGISTVEVIDRPDLQRLEVRCFYTKKGET